MRPLLLVAFLSSAGLANAEPSICMAEVTRYQPKAGVIPSAEIAQTVALAYLKPIYGSKVIENEKPYTAIHNDGIWFVQGSLAQGAHGGVAEIKLCRRNGAVLSITHGK